MTYGSDLLSRQGRTLGSKGHFGGFARVPGPAQYEAPYGNVLIGAYALAAQRHMHEYGTTPEQLAEIAVGVREHAALNPDALYQDPITMDDVVSSRMIPDPLLPGPPPSCAGRSSRCERRRAGSAERLTCGYRSLQGQPTDGPRPSDCGVLESGEGCGMPSSRDPNSVMRAALPPHGVCSSATREFVVSSRPATDAPFCSAALATRSGSMMPMSIMFPKRPSRASKPSSTPSWLVRSTTSSPE